MKLAVITLSIEGLRVAMSIRESIPETDIFVNKIVDTNGVEGVTVYPKVAELTAEIFNQYKGIVFIAPTGAVIRAISPNIKSKLTDPAVVVLDVGARHAISLLSGHEGGANDLAISIGNIVGAEPVVTTTTEAVKNYIVGLGMRRGKPEDEIIKAVKTSLAEAGIPLEKVRYLASADIKSDEEGLLAASETLGVPVRFIPSDEIRNSAREFAKSDYVQKSVNLPAVAEPAALLAGRRTQLIQQRRAYEGITVAIAKENCTSLG